MPSIRAYRSFGVSFLLQAATPAELETMVACLPHQSSPDPHPVSDAHLFTLPQAPDPHDQLRQDLMVHVANHAPHHVFVHAGVVSHAGRGLMLPGTSFAGKTTLVAALVRAGAVYYSDEYAVLDPTGLTLPYTRDLSMRQPGSPLQQALPVAELGGTPGLGPLRISHVLFTRFAPDAVWHPAPVTPGMAILEMLRHTIPVQRTPARAMATLNALMSAASAWSSPRGETAELVPRLLNALTTGEPLQ